MKAHFLVGIAVVLAALNLSKANPEPTYQGKPVNYWLEGLRLFPDCDAPKLEDSITALAAIGAPGLPAMSHFSWYDASGLLESTLVSKLNTAVSFFSEADKDKVRILANRWLTDPDPQVKAAGIALSSRRDPDRKIAEIEVFTNEEKSDPLLPFAFRSCWTVRSAGWEKGYRVSMDALRSECRDGSGHFSFRFVQCEDLPDTKKKSGNP